MAQSFGIVSKRVAFKASVTDITGVPYPSATKVITFRANCVTAFALAQYVMVTSELGGYTSNFLAAPTVLHHSVAAAQ